MTITLLIICASIALSVFSIRSIRRAGKQLDWIEQWVEKMEEDLR